MKKKTTADVQYRASLLEVRGDPRRARRWLRALLRVYERMRREGKIDSTTRVSKQIRSARAIRAAQRSQDFPRVAAG